MVYDNLIAEVTDLLEALDAKLELHVATVKTQLDRIESRLDAITDRLARIETVLVPRSEC